MKQNLLNKLWLRVGMIVAIMTTALAGQAWADEETVNFSEKGYGNGDAVVTYKGTSFTITFDKGTNSNGPKYYDTGAAVRVYGGNYFTVSSEYTIEEIVLTFATTGDGSNEITTDVGTYKTDTWTGSSNSVTFTIGGTSGHRRIASVAVTYTSGGSTKLEDNDLALTGAPIALNFDLYNNATAQTIHYTTSSTGEVSVEAGKYDVSCYVDNDAKTISVTPMYVTNGPQTVTVNQAADGTYKAGSVTFTVTVTDSTPIPTHKAVFSVNGAITEQEFVEGAAIEFPATPDNIYGKTFVGWTHFPISGTTDVAPTIYTSATMGDSDVFFYAVYAYASGESSNKSVTITPETSGVPTSYGTANTFTEYTFGGEKFQVQQMYLNGGKLQWRAEGNANGTGTMYNSESLGKITSIVLTYNSSDSNKNFTLKVGDSANPTGGTEVTPSVDGSTYTFDCSSLNYGFFVLTNGSNAGYLDGIVINYTIGSATYSDYCTTVSKVATFSYVDYQGEGEKDFGTSYTMYGIDVSISNDMFYGSTVAPYAYFYGYGDIGTGTTTITPHNFATITKVEIITPDTDHNGWQIIGSEKPGEITSSVGTVTANNEDKTKATVTTWTGSASEQFTITNTRTIAWSSIKVYYTGGLPKCATPAISGETSFITYSTVSISCATEGATIQYSTSTDGVSYTAYQPYTGPFQVSQTTIVKAQATKEGMVPSDEAYKGFVQHSVTPNIGYFISSHATNPFTDPEYLLLEDALVTYKNGNTAYIEDAYRAIMLYNCAGDLEAGDKVHGYMKVTGYTVYKNLPEITGFELVEGYVKTQEPEVNPTVVTLDELMGAPEENPYEMYLSKYVKIENATVTSAFSSQNCTIEQGGKSIVLRDQTGTLTSTVGDNVTVTGLVAIYNSTQQISVYEQNQIVVTAASPTIVATPSSLTGFTYGVGNGPSAAQSFTVSGKGLTDDITLTKGNDNYEMSLAEADGYTNSLTLPQSAGTVAATTIYVRLRAGLEMNPSYSGSIAITSTGATSKTVTLSGSVGTPYITWDLSKDETATATEDEMTWTSTYASMAVAKGTASTPTNNYYPGNGQSSTRFYKNSVLTVTPSTGYAVLKVVFEATSEGYASALKSSTWTNAAATSVGTTVTVTPKDPTNAWSAVIGGTCGFTSVKVYYEAGAAIPSITLNYNSVNFPIGGGDGTIDVTYNNIKNVKASIVWYTDEKANVTTTEPDWISAEINSSKNLYYVIGANTGAARAAYLKVYTKDDSANDVYSELITITQAGNVVDYATLPFEFNGGINDIASTPGLTQEGIGKDYASSPKLKFDGTGDYLILKINETPGTLTFDIKGNGFSDGTFTVQTSVDGKSYVNLKTYTGINSDGQTEEFSLKADVRYVKWIYTEKVTGNVGLGNIKLGKPGDATPTLTVSKTSLTGFTYVEGEGPSAVQTFEVTGTNIVGNVTLDLGEPSYYEISVSETTGFDSKLVLNKAEANPKTIFVRLKAGYEESASYEGTITITSEGAEEKEVYLNGSVTSGAPKDPYFVWDLCTNSYLDASEKQVSWLSYFASMILDQDASTVAANSYLGGYKAFTRFYGDQKLTITPSKGYTIMSVKFDTRSVNDANFLMTSTWTNASASAVGQTVTVTPKDGTAAFYAKIGTAIGVETVTYYLSKDITIDETGYATYIAPANVKFPSGLTAYVVSEVKNNEASLQKVTAVEEGTPVILKGEGTYTVEAVTYDDCDIVESNMLKGSFGTAKGDGTIYILAKVNSSVAFFPVGEGSVIPAGRAYLQVPVSEAGAKAFYFSFEDGADGINSLTPALSEGEGAIYNLAGQRISKMQKGINIVNGKKIAIK